MLIVRAAPEIQQQVEMLIRELDQPVDSKESPIQFYKLKNAKAVEVLYSLLALQQAAGSGQVSQASGFDTSVTTEGIGFTGSGSRIRNERRWESPISFWWFISCLPRTNRRS